jgi:hypothetical protein
VNSVDNPVEMMIYLDSVNGGQNEGLAEGGEASPLPPLGEFDLILDDPDPPVGDGEIEGSIKAVPSRRR